MKLAALVASFIGVGLIAFGKQPGWFASLGAGVASESGVAAVDSVVDVGSVASVKTASTTVAPGSSAVVATPVKPGPGGLEAEFKKLEILSKTAKLRTSRAMIELELPIGPLFVRGTSSFRPQAGRELEKFMGYLAALGPDSKFEITYSGHIADKLTPEFRNQRAERVVTMIKRYGTQAGRIGPIRQVILEDTTSVAGAESSSESSGSSESQAREVASTGPSSSQPPHILIRVRTGN